MSIARVLAAIAALCTGFALLAWLSLVTVVGGAMIGFGGDGPVAVRATQSSVAEPGAEATPATEDVRRQSTNDAEVALPSATGDVAAAVTAVAASATERATARIDEPTTAGPSAATPSATDDPPRRGTDGVSQLAVDWPSIPSLAGWTPVTTTASFAVYAADADDVVLTAAAATWAPRLESILDYVGDRVGRDLPTIPTAIVFARRYEAACPARGLAAPPDDERVAPLIMVFLDADTLDVQIRAVLAHEITHHLTMDDAFVGDGVLTEGIANWGAGAYALAWQGFDGWDDAARAYLASGDYVSVADPNGLVPVAGEPCIARRDRVYNVRSAFVDWLIARYGIEMVLAMPRTTIAVDAGNGETEDRAVPDYAAATGDGLTQLERRWLAELTRDAGGGDGVADDGGSSSDAP